MFVINIGGKMNKAIPRKILLSLAVVMLATLVAAPLVLASPATATRDLPATVAPSAEFDVGIVASGCGFGGQVRETLPAGFDYVSCSPDVSAIEKPGNQVWFTIFGDSADFSYTVQAPATAGPYTFAGVVLDEDLSQFTVGGDTSLTVSAAGTYTLTVTVSPAGSGTVTQDPDLAQYPAGTVVTLTADPNAGWEFSHWSGAASGTEEETTVTMNADRSVTAYFEEEIGPPGETFAWWLYETFVESL
jgi:hypothetical protein